MAPTRAAAAEPVVQVSFQQDVGGYTGTFDTYLAENLPSGSHGSLNSIGWDSDDPRGSGRDAIALVRFDNICQGKAGRDEGLDLSAFDQRPDLSA